MSKNPNKQNKQRKTAHLRVFSVIFAILIVLSLTLGALIHFDVVNLDFLVKKSSSSKDDEESDSSSVSSESDSVSDEGEFDLSTPYTPPTIDAEKYYKDNTNVKSTIDAATSPSVSSQSEAYSDFVDRGFDQNPITAEFSMTGEYLGEFEISRYSYDKNPKYQTFYVTSTGVVWNITEINGVITAMPVSYNSGNASTPIILSETNTITSYDNVSNKFFVNTPKSSVLVIKTVARIDSETLEKLTIGALDRL